MCWGVPGAEVPQKLIMNLLQEIMSRGLLGGPLESLSNQLNHDKSYLQDLQVKRKVDRRRQAGLRCWPGWAAPVRWRQRRRR